MDIIVYSGCNLLDMCKIHYFYYFMDFYIAASSRPSNEPAHMKRILDPRHDKTNKVTVRPAKTQAHIQIGDSFSTQT